MTKELIEQLAKAYQSQIEQKEAKAFKRNKPDCKVREISIFDVSKPCLF